MSVMQEQQLIDFLNSDEHLGSSKQEFSDLFLKVIEADRMTAEEKSGQVTILIDYKIHRFMRLRELKAPNSIMVNEFQTFDVIFERLTAD